MAASCGTRQLVATSRSVTSRLPEPAEVIEGGRSFGRNFDACLPGFGQRPACVVGFDFHRHADFDVDAGLPQAGGHHERIAAIVARPGHDPDRHGGKMRRMPVLVDDKLRRRSPGASH